MDLVLVRLAGARPPSAEDLRAALHRQSWVTLEAGRGVGPRAFAMAGGHVRVLTKLPDEPWYEAPCLQARLSPDADFGAVAPRLVVLAGELGLGIATTGSKGAMWWPAPEPSGLAARDLERAVAASRACEGALPRRRWWGTRSPRM